MKAAVVKETAPGERRVALVPEAVARLQRRRDRGAGGAGRGRGRLADRCRLRRRGGGHRRHRRPVRGGRRHPHRDQAVDAPWSSQLGTGQAIIGMLAPLTDPELAAALAARGVTAISLDGLPRTLSRAQAMDALTSQANVAGYKAALVAAAAFGRFFPLLITAAGTARPAKVLVLGAGVAGLQAIGTARRLGAVVSGYDVRPASKGEVESLGATFIELTSVGSAAGEGGYARELTAEERQAQQDELTAPHRPARRGDHHRAGARAQAAAAGHRRRGQGDGGRLGHRGHGRQRARRQRGRLAAGRDGRHRQRRHGSSAPTTCPPPCRRRPRTPTRATSPRCCCT